MIRPAPDLPPPARGPFPASRPATALPLAFVFAFPLALATAWLAPTALGQEAGPPPATVPGGALEFSGHPGQGVVAPESAPSAFAPESGLTIEAWVKVYAWSQRYQPLATKGDAWGLVRADDTGRISFRTALPGQPGAFHDLAGPEDFPLGVWTHVAAVWTGTRKQLYLDGELVADAAYAEGLEPGPFPVMLGANAQHQARVLEGAIDSVRIWAVARTAEQIQRYRAENLRGSEDGLLADWRFDEGAGPVAFDSSAAERHGLLTEEKPTPDGEGLPQRIDGLLLAPPSEGDLALLFRNRTAQYPQAPGATPVDSPEGVEFPSPNPGGAFDFANGFTAEVWVKPSSIPSEGPVVVLSKGAGAWEIRYRANAKITFFTAGLTSTAQAGDQAQELFSAARVDPGEWTHVAAVWDAAAMEKRLFINGQRDASTPVEGTLGHSAETLSLGLRPGQPAPSSAYFGAADELRLWRIPRSDREVQEHHWRRLNGSEPGLAGLWSFDEAEGQAADEGSGRALPGELSEGMSSLNRVEGVRLGPPGLASYTLDLDGESQYLTVPDHPALNGLTSLTIEAWIKPKEPKAPGFMMIASKGEGGWGLGLDADRHLRFMVNSIPFQALKSAGTVPLGEWSHVAVVVDGAAGTTTFYINGKPSGVVPSAVIAQSPGDLSIGKAGGLQLSGFFHGGIDELRIWDHARNSTEVLLLAFSELTGAASGMAGHWSFTEGSGDSVANRAEGGPAASIVGLAEDTWMAGPLFSQAPPLPQGLNFAQNSRAAGLWIGEVVLDRVNEVQRAVNGVAEAVSPTGKEAVIRIILHVDGAGQVRLLKDLIVMQTQPEGVPQPPARPVLVTDPSQIHLYEGVVSRGGKLVGLRYSTVAFDFPGFEMPMIGGVGAGAACAGRIDIDRNAPTNPYRHKFHPDHGEGFDIVRVFSLEFDGAPGDPLRAAPGYGVDRISGTYRESIAGLHKITLTTEGAVTLNRISTVPALNAP